MTPAHECQPNTSRIASKKLASGPATTIRAAPHPLPWLIKGYGDNSSKKRHRAFTLIQHFDVAAQRHQAELPIRYDPAPNWRFCQTTGPKANGKAQHLDAADSGQQGNDPVHEKKSGQTVRPRKPASIEQKITFTRNDALPDPSTLPTLSHAASACSTPLQDESASRPAGKPCSTASFRRANTEERQGPLQERRLRQSSLAAFRIAGCRSTLHCRDIIGQLQATETLKVRLMRSRDGQF